MIRSLFPLKFTGVLLLLIAVYVKASAQLDVTMSPNSGTLGQTLITTLTSQTQVFTQGCFITYVSLKKSGSAYTINPNGVYYNYISGYEVEEQWTIPLLAPVGNYDLFISGQDSVPNAFAVNGYLLTGQIYFDEDSNGTMNGNDHGLPQQMVRLLPDSTIAISDENGFFGFGVLGGNYTIEYLPQANWVPTTAPSYSLNVNSNTTNLDFGTQAIVDTVNLSVIISSELPRCNQGVNFFITATNTGTVNIASGTLKFVKPSNSPFVSSSPPPYSVTVDTIIWNYSNLLVGLSQVYTVVLLLPGAGSSVYSTAYITGEDIGGTLIGTRFNDLQQTVSCSFDPNDKAANPAGVGPLHLTLLSDTLEYTIRFQNTGNDTAFNIVIRDTLSSLFNKNTFRVLASSYPVQTSFETNGAISFRFSNILLPDSNVNEPASHGYVVFSVVPVAGLPDTTEVYNTAYIYFDLNDPVVTNTTLNTLVEKIIDGIDENPATDLNVQVLPNLFTDKAYLTFNNPDGEEFLIRIFDASGRKVSEVTITSGRFVIDGENVSAGLYFYALSNLKAGKTGSGKFMVIR